MQMVTISLRLPKTVSDQLDAYIAEKGYATKTEVVRDLIRTKLAMESLEKTRGALKGQGIVMPKSMTEWRKKDWQRLLAKANGNEKKALALLQIELDEVAQKLGLKKFDKPPKVMAPHPRSRQLQEHSVV
ncbi:hypothetical protein HYV43_01725 [Candidatus Micrarchaeota archaeon]|nr:hypothetical protein [Candidatus Micrarchaeota archaeon]